MPGYFTSAFAHRLNELCSIEVKEASDGDLLQVGLALLAPGGFHMKVKGVEGHWKVVLDEGPKIHHQRPCCGFAF